MNIRKKILLAFIAITVIAIFFTAIVALDSARNILTNIISENLARANAHKKMMIEMYYDDIREDMSLIGDLKGIVEELPAIHPSNGSGIAKGLARLGQQLNTIKNEKKFENILLVNPEGKIVYALSDLHGGKKLGTPLNEYLPGTFDAGRNNVYVSGISKNRSVGASFIIGVAPVQGEDGKFLGEVVAEVKTDEIFDIIQNRLGMGNSGETIVSKQINDKEIQILSPLRYPHGNIPNEVVTIGSTVGIGIQHSATEGVGSSIISDYRGVRSLAHWDYIPSLGWGIISKLDEEEAFMSIKNLRGNVLLILLISILGIIAVSQSISRSIVSPIVHLQKQAKIISRGDIDHRIEITSGDETGVLARAFNKMTGRLQGMYQSLDNKVKRRTETIEKEKSKFLALAQNLPVGVMMVEKKNHRIVAINKSMVDLLMISSTPLGKKIEAISRTYMNFRDDDGSKISANHTPIVAALSDEKKIGEREMQLDRTHQGDGVIWVRTMVSLIKDENEKTIFITMVMEDITREKQVDRAKSEFVSLASHQFRTPLTAINWYVEILLKECGNKMSARQKMLINEVANGGRRLGTLVNTMLNISRIDMDTFTLELKEVDVKSVVKKVLKDVERRVKEHRLHVEVSYQEKLPNMIADESAVEIVIQNLVTNAVKYTKYEGAVIIRVSVLKKNETIGGHKMTEGSFVIMVKDNGYGIKKSEQKNVFTKFYRASNVRNVPAEGTGLGLYLVKNMLDHTGGSIWFESDENKGSSFYVALPLTGMRPHKGKEGGKKLETLSTASIESEILSSAGSDDIAKEEKSRGKGKKKK